MNIFANLDSIIESASPAEADNILDLLAIVLGYHSQIFIRFPQIFNEDEKVDLHRLLHRCMKQKQLQQILIMKTCELFEWAGGVDIFPVVRFLIEQDADPKGIHLNGNLLFTPSLEARNPTTHN